MQKRELWKVIVFGIITLGIYDLVWIYKTRNEMVAKGQKIPSFWLLFAPLLGLVAVAILQFILRFVLAGATPDAPIEEARVLSKVINIFSVLTGVVALLALLPVALYWFYTYCKAVEVVTKGKLALGLNYIMFLVLGLIGVGFLWPALVQDAFNKTR
ncbi:MAG TPA: DUF4234 domain-containing protein [Candidatus Saccharimonadales bacterium]|nr:DUF4234 domain-containing protein [Candidatus Saccharimonadales bacterium]